MDDQRFWQIIESTGPMATPKTKEHNLRTQLQMLSVDELLAFDRIYDAKMQRAYTWDLWGAAYLICCGCSDDAFTEFRNYVISRGREFYEQAVSDPDSLASRLEALEDPDDTSAPLVPQFDLIAGTVYRRLTGRQIPISPIGEPTGAKWTETRADLAPRFPKCWQRFGDRWSKYFEQH